MTFNDFSNVPFIPYKIIEHLLKDKRPQVQDIWKLLKYQTPDALKKPDLTTKEKVDMVWNGIDSHQENYTIFFKQLIGNALDTAQEQVKFTITRYGNIATDNNSETILIYEIEMIIPETSAIVRYGDLDVPVERTDLLESYILNAINGMDIGVCQPFMFNRNLSSMCKSYLDISNSKSFYGRSLFIATRLINPKRDGGCQ